MIIFVPLETGMNTLRRRHKKCHFNRTKSPLYLVKLKMAQNGRTATAVRSVKPIVPNFLSQLDRKFFQQSSDRKYFTFAWVFITNVSSNSIWLILARELKINCL